MMRRCVCLVSDRRLLFPTLLAAVQARAQAPADLADVVLFAIEPDARAAGRFSKACAAEGIGFSVVDGAVVGGTAAERMVDAVGGSIGMYARLFLDRFVPDRYDRLLYLDGDVQVRRSLEPLLKTHVAPGRFLAARDPMTFLADEPGAVGARVRRYMDGLGLSADRRQSYFNSGVLFINRDGWGRICRSASEFLQSRGDACDFHDQSALNAVAGGQHDAMSFRWNFPIFFRNCGVEPQIAPAIYHFMSSPKPWHGSFPPWDARSVEPYRALLRKHPQLADYYPEFAAWKAGKYFLQQRWKQVVEIAGWRLSRRRGRILTSERATVAI